MTEIESVIAIVFWLCVFGVLYEWVGYPFVIGTLSALFGRSREYPHADPDEDPLVTVLIAARNEESVIAERIDNALALDYPRDRVEIVIVSDGSTDRTAAIVRACEDPRVKLVEFPEARGKGQVFNAVIPRLTSDIVVLSDANTTMQPSALRRFVRWFQEDKVGVVVGRLVLTDPATGRNVDGLYWRYETFLKKCEARLGALLGANGALYAIRRSLFQPLPKRTLVDDLVMPLLIKMRSRCDIVYDMNNIAREETPSQIRDEFRRRSRIGAGGFQSLALLWRLFNPKHGWIAFTFASHKLLRWTCPFLLLGALGSNVILVEETLYQVALGAQGALYAASLAGAVVPGSTIPVRVLRLSTMFVSMHAALLAGFWVWLRGTAGSTWERTARVTAPELSPGGDVVES